MQARLAVSVTVLALVVVSCNDRHPAAPAAVVTAAWPALISDGAHGSGNQDFFFLPPLAGDPSRDPRFDRGKFNPRLRPTVQVFTGPADCDGATRPVFGPVVAPAYPGEELYKVEWNTAASDLEPGTTYRLCVYGSAQGTSLGFLDVQPVSGGMGHVPSGELYTFQDDRTVPIKFRLEEGALCTSRGDCAEISVDAAGGRVTVPAKDAALSVPPGAVRSGDTVTVVIEPEQPQYDGRCLPGGLVQAMGCYHFRSEPASYAFAVPVRMEACVDAGALAGREDLIPALRLYKYNASGGLVELPPVPADALIDCAASGGAAPRGLAGLGSSFSDVGGAVPSPVLLALPAGGSVGQAGLVASATGGVSTGEYSYASATPLVCTVEPAGTWSEGVNSSKITTLASGSCSVTATKAPDAIYLEPQTSEPGSFTVTPGAQAAVVLAVPASATVSQPGLAAHASGGSGTGAYGYASSTPSVCTVVAATGVITAAHVGTCTLTGTRSGDANYLAATSAPQGFLVARGGQAPVVVSVPGSGYVGQAGLAAHASGGSGTGSYAFASSTPTVCTVVAATGAITVPHAGTCTLTATRAADADYLPATSAAQQFQIAPGPQATVVVKVPGSGAVGQAGLVATASGGSGTGTYGYASSTPAVCTVDAASGGITARTVGQCVLSATKAADADYQPATSVAQGFQVSQGVQAAVVVTVPTSGYVGQPGLAATAGGGSGTGAYGFASSTTSICTVVAATGSITALHPGSCTLTASRAGDANYVPATSAAQGFHVSQGIQADVVVTVPGAGYVGEIGLVARAGGGSGTGAYGFASSTPAVCTVAGATGGITASHAGWCTLTATREGDVNYLPATSAPQGFQVAPGAQAAVLLAVPGSGTVGQLGLVAHASGGSGTGAYSYASSTPIVCTVVGATGSIVVSHVGTCTLTATRAGDADFVPATSAAQSFEAGPGVQSTVWLSVPGSGHVGQTDLVAHASGGSGTGAYSYASSTPSVCTVDAATGSIAATTVGECRLTATRAADADYQSATSAAGWFWVDKRLQAPVVLTVPAAGRVDQERLFAVASGGSGSGQYRYASLTPAICGVNQLMGNIWATAVGTCSLRATKLGDAEYLPATSAAQSFQVDKGTQAPLVLTVPASGYVGEPGLVATASGGSGTGAYVFTSYSWYVCSVDAATGGITASSAGTCRLTVTKAGDANYLGDTSEVQSFVVDKQKQAPVLLTVPEVGLVGQSGLVATASGGSGTGAFSYVSHSPSFCDVDPVTGSITAKAGGVCILSATKAGDADFQPATSGWKSFNVLLGY